MCIPFTGDIHLAVSLPCILFVERHLKYWSPLALLYNVCASSYAGPPRLSDGGFDFWAPILRCRRWKALCTSLICHALSNVFRSLGARWCTLLTFSRLVVVEFPQKRLLFLGAELPFDRFRLLLCVLDGFSRWK